MRHLRPWHEFVKKCHINDVDFMERLPIAGRRMVDGVLKLPMPSCCLLLPEWTKHVTEDARLKFQERAAYHLNEAWTKYQGVRAKEFPFFRSCAGGDCGSLRNPGYPLASAEECMMHLREVHGADDAEIARLVHDWETRNSLRLSQLPFDMTVAGDLLTPRESRKRGAVTTADGIKFLKKSRR